MITHMRCWFVLVVLVSSFGVVHADEKSNELNEHLSVFKGLVGKTWKGEFAGSTPEKPMHDVSKWERAMNGQAVRVTHSVNNGIYGGETIFMWDKKEEKIAFWYFTTDGFHTHGTLEIDGNKWSSTEEVTGNANGITKVKSVSTLKDNGDMEVKSEYFAKDQWQPGHEILYKLSPDSTVIFK